MTRRSRPYFALAAASALAALADSGFAGSQLLYKCVDGSRTVYQQQACPVSAAPEAPASAVHAAPAPAAAMQKVKSAFPSASAAPATPR
jgi:hypothetical protein